MAGKGPRRVCYAAPPVCVAAARKAAGGKGSKLGTSGLTRRLTTGDFSPELAPTSVRRLPPGNRRFGVSEHRSATTRSRRPVTVMATDDSATSLPATSRPPVEKAHAAATPKGRWGRAVQVITVANKLEEAGEERRVALEKLANLTTRLDAFALEVRRTDHLRGSLPRWLQQGGGGARTLRQWAPSASSSHGRLMSHAARHHAPCARPRTAGADPLNRITKCTNYWEAAPCSGPMPLLDRHLAKVLCRQLDRHHQCTRYACWACAGQERVAGQPERDIP